MARTKGTKQLAVEVSELLFDEIKEFCAARGETVRYHLEMAFRRHMDNPPPPPAPALVSPLPPITPPEQIGVKPPRKSAAKKPKGKK